MHGTLKWPLTGHYIYCLTLFSRTIYRVIMVQSSHNFAQLSWHVQNFDSHLTISSYQTSTHVMFWLWACTPLFKCNWNLFCNVKWWYLFSRYRFEIFRVAWWGLLHLLWKISWVYVTAPCLCEHSNLVRFDKRVAKTPRHGLRFGNILMLYNIINTWVIFLLKLPPILFW